MKLRLWKLSPRSPRRWHMGLLSLAVIFLLGDVMYSPGLPVPNGKATTLAHQLDPIVCDADLVRSGDPLQSHYFYSKRYGWFDKSHFYTGNPAKLIDDVRRVSDRGGGIIRVRQEIHGGVTGYTARYAVAADIPEAKLLGVALGIYYDWSHRFETWEGQPPQGFWGPFTAFALEDLPSHYVSFFASANDLPIAYVLACYLGGVERTEIEPPRLSWMVEKDLPAVEGIPVVQQIANRSFAPLIYTDEGWQNIPWPKHMRIASIGSSSGLWDFVEDSGWYLHGRLTSDSGVLGVLFSVYESIN